MVRNKNLKIDIDKKLGDIMDFKESKTYKNLEKAFEGEAKAHLKYQFYKSKIANTSKELENLLDEIVHNEKEHGKIWFKLLHNGEVPTDEENLQDAITGELMECKEMYPNFAKIAYEEGFNEIGDLFTAISKIEGQHAQEFSVILENIEKDYLFSDEEEVNWICLNCGHIYYGKHAPDECPVCKHPQKYFVRL